MTYAPVVQGFTIADVQEFRDEIRHLTSELEQLERMTVGWVRLGIIHLDPVALTAKLRAIEPSIKVESDGSKIIVYAKNQVPEAKPNDIEALFRPSMDKT